MNIQGDLDQVSRKKLTLMCSIGLVILLVLMVWAWRWNIRSNEISLRNTVLTAQDNMTFTFDSVSKTIIQKSQVTNKYARDNKEISAARQKVVVNVIENQYSSGREFQRAMQAVGMNVDPTMYADLSRSIESLRMSWEQEQKTARDKKREHDVLIDTYGWALPGKEKIDLKFVTSASTKESFETGEENDIELFSN